MGRKERWTRVSAEHPCPICGNKTYCGVSPDGKVARCMRSPSAKESSGSDGAVGFIHRLDSPITPVRREPKEAPPKLSIDELTALAKRMYEHPHAPRRREQTAEHLGVSVESLERLKVGYGVDKYGGREFSSWPMRDWRGRIVGIVRRYDDGSKKSWHGGSTGLFVPQGWRNHPGIVLVVEGGSDTAAGDSCGVAAIGRPSNVGGSDWVRRILRGRKALVVGEHDQKPERRGQLPTCPTDCEGCGHCYPGLYGARLCAERIGCGYVMPPDGVKDFRELLNQGRVWSELIRAL